METVRVAEQVAIVTGRQGILPIDYHSFVTGPD